MNHALETTRTPAELHGRNVQQDRVCRDDPERFDAGQGLSSSRSATPLLVYEENLLECAGVPISSYGELRATPSEPWHRGSTLRG